jgi:hypothetical protein
MAGGHPNGTLASAYERLKPGPVISGDHFEMTPIVGFAFVPSGDQHAMGCDVMLFAGDRTLTAPPQRQAPSSTACSKVIAYGEPPPWRLPPERIQRADAEPLDLATGTETLFGSSHRLWYGVIAALFDELAAYGHFLWLAGGAVRDLALGLPADAVNDLDLAGTAPTAAFAGILERWLTRTGLAELRVKVSPSTVCSLAPASQAGRRLCEYKALNLPGFAFCACGGDLETDSSSRDLTINCLFYDPLKRLLLDPTGRALHDVKSLPIKLTVVNSAAEPAAQAIVLLRAIKFVARYSDTGRGADISQLTEWTQSLPLDVLEMIPDADWRRISNKRLEYRQGIGLDREQDAAQRIGRLAVELLSRLDGRL